jgi:hypothetical protein
VWFKEMFQAQQLAHTIDRVLGNVVGSQNRRFGSPSVDANVELTQVLKQD